MMAGVAKQRRGAGRKGRTSSVSREAAATFPNGGRLLEDRGGLDGRKVFDVWYTPTIKDVYAQLKVAETMLSRCTDPALAIVKRKMYELEDTMWQFIEG